MATEITEDTELEAKKLKCKTQNQNSKLKTNDRF